MTLKEKRRKYLESLIERIKKGEVFRKENQKILLDFFSLLIGKGLSYNRILRYLFVFKLMEKFSQKPFVEWEREDVIKFLEGMNKKNYSAWTIYTTKAVLKKFFQWLRGYEEGYPEEVSWIKLSKKKNNLPEILTKDEIKKLIDSCDNIRDKALISVLYESGARDGEILNMKVGDVYFDEYGCVIIVSGKTGMRRIRLVSSAPLLGQYLEEHPFKDDPKYPLWISLASNKKYKPLGYQSVRAILRKLAKKSGIKKRLYPHLFRHSRATHLAKVLTESQLKEMFGWTQSSGMASVYVHLSGRDVDNAILEIYGLKKKKEEGEKVIKCPRCGEINEIGAKVCWKCGFVLDPEFAKKMEERKKKEEDFVYKVIRKLIERDPMIRKKIYEIVEELGGDGK